VKSQIHAGGRGKGRFEGLGPDAKGGVRVVKSVERRQANAAEMLGRTLVTIQTGPKGKQVNRLYIEEGADITKEFYLSLAGRPRDLPRVGRRLDRRRHGHRGVAHATPEKISHLLHRSGDRRLAAPRPGTGHALGLKGDLAKQARAPARQLYEAFVAKDMSMLEVNPLIVTADDKLRVLDAKVSFDSTPCSATRTSCLRDETEEDPKEIEASKYDLSYIALDGEIGCMVNGAAWRWRRWTSSSSTAPSPPTSWTWAAAPTRPR
jgi:succinyl-CoA synthetase beta subunit